jgi:hypothetical protein
MDWTPEQERDYAIGNRGQDPFIEIPLVFIVFHEGIVRTIEKAFREAGLI